MKILSTVVAKMFINRLTYLGVTNETIQDIIADPETMLGKFSMQPFNNPEACSFIAGAIRMHILYKKTPKTVLDYVNIFGDNLQPQVRDFIIDNCDALANSLDSSCDFMYGNLAASTLINNYLAKIDGVYETPQFMIMRVAVGISRKRGLDFVKLFIANFNSKLISIASPTYYNAGFIKGAPTSCMVMVVADELEDIYDVLKETAMASKNNAGIGLALNHLRHSKIGNQGNSKGIIPLLKLIDDSTNYVDQGGRRPGATTVSLPVWHYDIWEFVKFVDKVNTDGAKKLNVSVMFTDLFMRRLEEDGDWYVMCPTLAKGISHTYGKEQEDLYLKYEQIAISWNKYQRYTYLSNQKDKILDPALLEEFKELCETYQDEVQVEFRNRKYKAREIFTHIVDMQRKSGMPYIIHGDTINECSPNKQVGLIHSLNLCQEIALPTKAKEQTASCNIASICLKNMVTFDYENAKYIVDYQKLEEITRFMICVLNDILDSAENVHEKVKKSNALIRPIGLGVNGWAEMLYQLDIPSVINVAGKLVNNPEVMDLIHTIWSCIYYNALWSSMTEAKKYGTYEAFKTSEYTQGILQYHMYQKRGVPDAIKTTPAEPFSWGQLGSWNKLISLIRVHGLRNSTVTTQMPTATSAQILEASESTEISNNLITRRLGTGDFIVQNFYLVSDLKSIGLWTRENYLVMTDHNGSIQNISEEGLTEKQLTALKHFKMKYLTIWEIPQKCRIVEEAQRQMFTDQARSFNVYLPDPEIRILQAVHSMIFKYGLKSSYYIRSQPPMRYMQMGRKKKSTEDEIKALMCTSCDL